MRKNCVQAVDSLRGARGCIPPIFPHLAAASQTTRVKTLRFPHFSPTPSPVFPHRFFVHIPPLRSTFSPQSTEPITTTTKYICN